MSRSPFFYVGDKYKLMGQINSSLPKNINRLIEAFCGGGSVFLNSTSNFYLANDNSKYMIKLHKFISGFKNNREKFFDKLEKTIKKYGLSASFLGINVDDELKKKYVKTYYAVYNKKSYSNLRDDFNKNKENMLLLYVLLIYGFNHMIRFNSNGDFNLPVGNVDYNKNVVDALNGYFDFMEKNQIEFYCKDYKSFLKNIAYENGDFVYLDPPYLISQSEYNKYWTEKEEKELLNTIDWLNENGVKFALSNVFYHKGKYNNLLIEWSKKYNVIDMKSNYISYHDNTIKNSKEVLITNYEQES